MSEIIILPETTKDPISLIGRRAGICWGADISDKDKNYKRGLDCLKSGHTKTFEYVNIETYFSGNSARVFREWYTHTVGSPTRLQSSTRYIDYKNFNYITPPSILNNVQAKAIFDYEMQNISKSVAKLEQIGIPREDTALLLPLGMQSSIVDKRNLESAIQMSHRRLCTRANWEYRNLFIDWGNKLASISDEWDTVVRNFFKPSCEVCGYCIESKCCGRMPKKEIKIV